MKHRHASWQTIQSDHFEELPHSFVCSEMIQLRDVFKEPKSDTIKFIFNVIKVQKIVKII